MKVYLEGVNVAVDRGAPFQIVFIPVGDSRLFDHVGDNIGVFDEITEQTYQSIWSEIQDKNGGSYGANKGEVLDALSGFIGEDAGSGGGGATSLAELTDVDLTGVKDGTIFQWDAASAKMIPSKVTQHTMRFDGSTDTIVYQDDYCEIRWNAVGQPQFRVKGNWSWFDAGIWLVRGNSQTWRRRSDDIDFYTDTNNWSGWYYFTQSGTYDSAYDFGFWGAKAISHLTKETGVRDGAMPTYSMEWMRGDTSSVTVVINVIYT